MSFRRFSATHFTSNNQPYCSPYRASHEPPFLHHPSPTYTSGSKNHQLVTLPSPTSFTPNHTHLSTIPRNASEFSRSFSEAQAYRPLTQSPLVERLPQYSSLCEYWRPGIQSQYGPLSDSISHDRSLLSEAPSIVFSSALDLSLWDGQDNDSENDHQKRKGNLPKEITNILRAWLMSHLQHPYPTKDEKEELIGQTGLDMDQICNWFVNARRRKLPAIISEGVGTDARHLGRSITTYAP